MVIFSEEFEIYESFFSYARWDKIAGLQSVKRESPHIIL